MCSKAAVWNKNVHKKGVHQNDNDKNGLSKNFVHIKKRCKKYVPKSNIKVKKTNKQKNNNQMMWKRIK